MKRLLPVAALLASAAALATGITIDPTVDFQFSNCAAAGGAAQSVDAGTYLFRVEDETVYLCYQGQCDAGTGGLPFPNGTIVQVILPTTLNLSCRSTNATGDMQFTKAQ